MAIVKRLDTFVLQRFVPLLVMTFFICLFIVMMQFLWRFIEDLVGKGLSIDVIGELFFYASLTMVPTALPLAVLLASLMTFGNLGEKLELTAMKSAGISLVRIMAPLMILMSMIATGAFFFQNDVLPVAQTKMWTLLFSMRQKSPEVEIPERAFYDQIPGLNLYVESKNKETGMLYDLIIYDTSRGMDNASIILADSGRINFTEDKTYLFVHLYKGAVYGNDRSTNFTGTDRQNMPFSRETFDDKQLYYFFDSNFNRIDEGGIRSQYVGKNISELNHAIDSLQEQVDSIGRVFGTEIKETQYVGVPYYTTVYRDGGLKEIVRPDVKLEKVLDIDSVFNAPSANFAKSYITGALNKVQQQEQLYKFKSAMLSDQQKLMRRHDIEKQRKFTLSLACIIFFFIGAPLGAIIKKGGIGTPLVISVFLFIIYYFIDNTGYKAARDGTMFVWAGIWLSSALMLPLGIYVTYKAVGDFELPSMSFDAKKRLNRLKRRFGMGRSEDEEMVEYHVKEFILNEVENDVAIRLINEFVDQYDRAVKKTSRLPMAGWLKRRRRLKQLAAPYASLVDYLSNSRSLVLLGELSHLPGKPLVYNHNEIVAIFDKIKGILQPYDPNNDIELESDNNGQQD